MLIDAILKLHDNIKHEKLGPHREAQIEALENDALSAVSTSQMQGLLR
jgi:NADH-quinone oxidoreductase subunit B